MKKLYLLSIFLLSACATNEVLYTDANGVAVYKAQCDQRYNLDMGHCIQMMGQQCPYGFNIIMANNEAKGLFGGSNTNGYMNTNTFRNANAFVTGNNIFANATGTSNTSFNFRYLEWGVFIL